MEDKELILTPDAWPNWPLLPMKKSVEHGMPNVAVMVDAGLDTGKVVLYLANMWSENLTGSEKLEFASVDDLLEAGWRVD